MNAENQSIEALIVKSLCGQTTTEEAKTVERWAETHPQEYAVIMDGEGLAEAYGAYSKIDDRKAWDRFRDGRFDHKPLFHLRPFHYAAAAVAVLIAVAVHLLHNSSAGRPPLTQDVRIAMHQSRQTDKSEATLSIGTQRIVVRSPEELDLETEGISNEDEFDARYILETERGKEFWITLGDGSRVHLNYDTRLKFPVRFEDDNRSVFLDGEAYFDVAKDASRPFRVVTGNGVVEVYGTSFDVNTTAVPNATQVVLVEGSVAVKPSEDVEYPLLPGQMAEMRRNAPPKLSTIDVTPYVSWNTGTYVFDGTPLATLMDVLSKWSNHRVVFRHGEARKILFSGNIDKYNDLKTTIEAIEYVTGLHIELTPTEIIIDK